MAATKIEWCDVVWNPITGCHRVSEGCERCYAAAMAWRFWGERKFGEVQIHDDKLIEPFGWKKPRRVFVDSMGDLFHPGVEEEWLDSVYTIMGVLARHTFLVLTKRPRRMLEWYRGRGARWAGLENVWMGVSAENQRRADERIPALLEAPVRNRFVSCEPLLGPVELRWFRYPDDWYADALRGIHWRRDWSDLQYGTSKLTWVIAGGESGPGARPCNPEWARGLRDQCSEHGTPFFFKQWGEWAPNVTGLMGEMGSGVHFWEGSAEVSFYVGKKRAGRLLDGVEWNGFPEFITENTEITENN